MNTARLDEFVSFLDREIVSAVSELQSINEESRRHLQKLVYTNLVDRFDSTVDHTLLDNVLEEPLLAEGIKCLEQPLSEGEAFRFLAGLADPKQHLSEKLRKTLRNGILRERHAKKARKLCEVLAPDEKIEPPRVNPSTGAIVTKFKPQDGKIPCTVQGYADWLYSRRNAIVHGGGAVAMLENDLVQLKKLYKCEPSTSVKLGLGSITTAARFYRELITLIKKE